jgi:hypothetical protein
MSINWKPVAVSALLAFIIAVISAGLSGIPFGILLFRAVLGAFIFGAGTVGVQLIIGKFLPELNGSPAEESGDAGGTVDIVISDDEDSEAEPHSELGDEEPAPSAAGEQEGEESFEPGLQFATFQESEGEPLVQEVEEAEEAEAPPASADHEFDEEVTEEVASSVDSLPDVGEFSGSFMADATSEASTPTSTEPTGDGSSGDGVSGEGQDPQAIAKAIRTLMKREES